MIDLDQIKDRILRGEQIEKIVKEINWREFEELVEEIFKKHDFTTFRNLRFKTKKRYEIDVLAVARGFILAIDCKQWGRGRYKKTGLKRAIKTQKERTKELKKFLKNNPILKARLKTQENTRFIPLIVTWYEEDLLEHANIFIVPIWKLNEFLLTLSEYI
jgi:Holliday junction resolvase